MYISFIFLGLGLISLANFCLMRDKKSSCVAIQSKTVTSILFIAVALSSIGYLAFEGRLNSENIVACLFIIMGLVFGLVGDISLDFKIYFKSLTNAYEHAQKDNNAMTFLGMGAFGIGHLLYISSLLISFEDLRIYCLFALLISAFLVAILFFTCIKVMGMKYGRFLIPSIFYAWLLISFFVYSLIILIIDGYSLRMLLTLIGSILFLISDMTLSISYFSKEEDYHKEGIKNPESRFKITLIHVTYYLAQFIFALSIMFIS